MFKSFSCLLKTNDFVLQYILFYTVTISGCIPYNGNVSKVIFVHFLDFELFESTDFEHLTEEKEDKLKLLSVSADKTIIIWHLDTNIDTWVENYRLGDVGGNISGFLGGKFSPSGEFIMGHDLRGAFHVWKYNVSNCLRKVLLLLTKNWNNYRNQTTHGHRKLCLVGTLMRLPTSSGIPKDSFYYQLVPIKLPDCTPLGEMIVR